MSEQQYIAIINIINIAVAAAVVWILLCHWLEEKLKAWVRKKYGGPHV